MFISFAYTPSRASFMMKYYRVWGFSMLILSHFHSQVLHNMYQRTAPIIIDNFSFYRQSIDTSTLKLTCASISCFESMKLEFYLSPAYFFRFMEKHRNVSLIFSKLYFSNECKVSKVRNWKWRCVDIYLCLSHGSVSSVIALVTQWL